MTTKALPEKHIYDPAFNYVRSAETDIRKTFERIRNERDKQIKRETKVRRIRRKGYRHAVWGALSG